MLIKQNSKIICSYDMLRPREFRAQHKSLQAHFLRPDMNDFLLFSFQITLMLFLRSLCEFVYDLTY